MNAKDDQAVLRPRVRGLRLCLLETRVGRGSISWNPTQSNPTQDGPDSDPTLLLTGKSRRYKTRSGRSVGSDRERCKTGWTDGMPFVDSCVAKVYHASDGVRNPSTYWRTYWTCPAVDILTLEEDSTRRCCLLAAITVASCYLCQAL